MRRGCWLVVCLAGACRTSTGTVPVSDTLAAKVPSQDGATTLDVGTWNLEWFGDTGNGPTNESLQLATVRAALLGMNLDIVGVQEVVSQAQWDQLKAGLPNHAGFLANDPRVSGGTASYSPGEQKVGLLYRTSAATLVGARIVLQQYDTQFAGRPPLEATFRLTLDGVTQEVVVVVLHMKAFADVESWQRRTDAAIVLKAWLDATHPTRRVFVIGDFNDDVDVSISGGRLTPYAAFMFDIASYAVPTANLSVARIPTTVGFLDAVDHQMVTNELASFVVAGSPRAIRLDQVIADYGTITSDHYPVVVSYRMR